jgi:acid phosphatase type 7
VGWNTYQQISKPCVNYGTSATALTQQACSTSSITYNTARTWSNAVTLTGLTPATEYYYQIVSTNSSVDHFYNISVVIDLGVYGENGFTIQGDASKRDTIPKIQPALNHTTIGRLAQSVNNYEFVVHPGDLAYADDWIETPSDWIHPEEAYEAIIENFYQQLAPVSGRKPYMASPGNHEADCEEINYTTGLCAEGQKNFTDFQNRFGRTMPKAYSSTSSNSQAKVNANKAAQLAVPPFFFSYEYGQVHYTMIDTETDFPNAPDAPGGSADLNSGPFASSPQQQLDFLAADLASVDRTVTPWLVVAGHRPWYTTGGGESCGPCQTAFEKLFYQYGVDLAIFGHVHNSQRFLPTYQNKADPAGYNNPVAPMYIVAGGAGNIEGLSSVGSNVSYNQFAYADDFSYATVAFLDKTHLQVRFIRSEDGAVLDTSTLYKAHSQQFVNNSS